MGREVIAKGREDSFRVCGDNVVDGVVDTKINHYQLLLLDRDLVEGIEVILLLPLFSHGRGFPGTTDSTDWGWSWLDDIEQFLCIFL
jgi:hypothetical protein